MTITLDMPENVFAALRLSPKEFAQELRLAAAIHWFQQGTVSQGKAAQIAGVSRAAFIDELASRKIDVIHVDMDDLREELARG